MLPNDEPVTTPVVGSTAAIAEASLLQTPPVVTSLSVVVLPRQRLVAPVMVLTAGDGLTVTEAVTDELQPAALLTV